MCLFSLMSHSLADLPCARSDVIASARSSVPAVSGSLRSNDKLLFSGCCSEMGSALKKSFVYIMEITLCISVIFFCYYQKLESIFF